MCGVFDSFCYWQVCMPLLRILVPILVVYPCKVLACFPFRMLFCCIFLLFCFFIKKSQEFLLLVWQSLSFAMGLSTHTSSFSFEMALCFVRFLLQKRVWWWYLTIIWCYSLKQILTLRLSLAVEYWGIVICDIEYP